MNAQTNSVTSRSNKILVIINTGSGRKSGDARHSAFMDRIKGHDGVTIAQLTPDKDITEHAAEGVEALLARWSAQFALHPCGIHPFFLCP